MFFNELIIFFTRIDGVIPSPNVKNVKRRGVKWCDIVHYVKMIQKCEKQKRFSGVLKRKLSPHNGSDEQKQVVRYFLWGKCFPSRTKVLNLLLPTITSGCHKATQADRDMGSSELFRN